MGEMRLCAIIRGVRLGDVVVHSNGGCKLLGACVKTMGRLGWFRCSRRRRDYSLRESSSWNFHRSKLP